jgi:hypothetical protein
LKFIGHHISVKKRVVFHTDLFWTFSNPSISLSAATESRQGHVQSRCSDGWQSNVTRGIQSMVFFAILQYSTHSLFVFFAP